MQSKAVWLFRIAFVWGLPLQSLCFFPSASALIGKVDARERWTRIRRGTVRQRQNFHGSKPLLGIKQPTNRMSKPLLSLHRGSSCNTSDASQRGGGPDGFDAERHAVELRDFGFTVIPDAGIDAALVEECRAACSAEHACLCGRVEELGLDAVEDNYAFAEIDTRHRLRWSFRPEDRRLRRLVDGAVPVASVVIAHLHKLPSNPNDASRSSWITSWMQRLLPSRPAVSYEGAILSSPGAKSQRFHADAGALHLQLSAQFSRHRLFNLFIPLIDLDEGGGGTMMWPGSHLWRTRADAYYAALERSGSLEADERAMSEMAVPACPAGGLLLFDSRLLHRGMPNEGGCDRAIAHAFLSTGLAADRKDTPASLQAALASLSSDPGERQQQREGFAREQRETWLKLRASSSS